MKLSMLMMKLMGWLGALVLAIAGASAAGAEYVTYLHADVQGSPLMATDEQGLVVWQEEYEPWGERQVKDTAAATSSRGSKVWYTGKEEEASLGMYYYGARWYSPNVGAFAAMDPAGVTLDNPRSFNRYAYANNNPVLYTDPDGRYAVVVLAIGLITFADYANAPGPQDSIYHRNGIEPFLNAIPAGRLVKTVGGGLVHIVSSRGEKAEGAAAPAPVMESSRAARREAMRQSSIPTSQQPASQSKNDSGREYSYDVPGSGGGTQRMSVQQQTMDRSHVGQPHWEAGKVKTDPLTGAERLNKYGRPMLTNDKSKAEYK